MEKQAKSQENLRKKRKKIAPALPYVKTYYKAKKASIIKLGWYKHMKR